MKETKEIKELLETSLCDWNGNVFKLNIDENIENIIGIVKYESYGDEFVIIITNNGTFEYGCYKDRRDLWSYDFIRPQTDDVCGKSKVDWGYIEADEFKITVTRKGTIRRWEDDNVRCREVRRDYYGEPIYRLSLTQFGYKES